MGLNDSGQKRWNDLGPDEREGILSITTSHIDLAFNHLVNFDEKLTRYIFITNGGGAVAGLGYLGTLSKGDPVIVWPITATTFFALGIVFAGGSLFAGIKLWGSLHKYYNDLSLKFSRNELTVAELTQPPPKGWARLAEHWAQRLSFGCFCLGAVFGLGFPLMSYWGNG